MSCRKQTIENKIAYKCIGPHSNHDCKSCFYVAKDQKDTKWKWMLCLTGENFIFNVNFILFYFTFFRKQSRQGGIIVPETWSDRIPTLKLYPEFLGN